MATSISKPVSNMHAWRLSVWHPARSLPVLDSFSRQAPVLDPRFSDRAEAVVATPERAGATQGYPKTIGVISQRVRIAQPGPAALRGGGHA